MSSGKRILNIFTGIIILLCAAIMSYDSESGYRFVVFIWNLSLIVKGIQLLFFYFTMARFMVGGISMLYRGILILDAGLFTLTLHTIPQIYVMLYLIGMFAFAGAIDVLQALESARMQTPGWKFDFFYGVTRILIMLICLINFKSADVVMDFYTLGLVYSGFSRIISAFRKTAVVYIE